MFTRKPMEEPPSLEVGHVVISRRQTPEDDRVEVLECYGPDGLPLPLTEALGMLRQAEDELLSAFYRQELDWIRSALLGPVTDEWDAERDATIIARITEILDARPERG